MLDPDMTLITSDRPVVTDYKYQPYPRPPGDDVAHEPNIQSRQFCRRHRRDIPPRGARDAPATSGMPAASAPGTKAPDSPTSFSSASTTSKKAQHRRRRSSFTRSASQRRLKYRKEHPARHRIRAKVGSKVLANEDVQGPVVRVVSCSSAVIWRI
jgi:hypothetical protein